MAIVLAPVFREVSRSTKLVWSLQKQNNLFASRPCGIEMHEPRQEGNFLCHLPHETDSSMS